MNQVRRLKIYLLGERDYPEAVVTVPEHMLGDLLGLIARARATNPALPLDAIIGTIWRLGSYRLGRTSYGAFRYECETRKDLRLVNTRGATRRPLIPSDLSHRRGARTPSIEFAIRQDVDRVRPGFFWPVLPAGLGRRFIRPASTARRVLRRAHTDRRGRLPCARPRIWSEPERGDDNRQLSAPNDAVPGLHLAVRASQNVGFPKGSACAYQSFQAGGGVPPCVPLLEAPIEYRGDNANHHPFTPRVYVASQILSGLVLCLRMVGDSRMPRLTTASLSFAVACVSLVGISPSDSTGVGAQEPTPYEIAATKNVMVRMRDGVHLATDIYRPARNGSPVEGTFPVLLERTPYNKEIENPDGTLSPVDPVPRARFRANRVVNFLASRGTSSSFRTCAVDTLPNGAGECWQTTAETVLTRLNGLPHSRGRAARSAGSDNRTREVRHMRWPSRMRQE